MKKFGYLILLIASFILSSGQESNAYGSSDVIRATRDVMNQSPLADAGQDQTVKAGSTVTLNGSLSTDSDGRIISYTWIQKEGPQVPLSKPNTVQPTFVAPSVDDNGTALVFELTVTDNSGLTSNDTVIVNVIREGGNQPPAANAGPDQQVRPGQTVTLNGSGSKDPNGWIVSYRWVQKSGPEVTLINADTVQPSLIAPSSIEGNSISMTFELTVTDNRGLKSSDTVTIVASGTPLGEFPVVGGSQMGKVVLTTIDPDEFDGFNLFLSQQVLETDTGLGRIYLSIEVVGITGMDGLMWFRPSDDRVPTYLKLAKGPQGFLAGAEENDFFEGRLTTHPRDLGPFFVGDLKNLRGVVLIFKTWYIREGEEFNADHLKHIQTVIASIRSDTDPTIPIPTIGGHEARGIVVDEILLYNLDPAFTSGFNLLLSQKATDAAGRLFVSLEVLGIPEWENLMWFRPSDDLVPPYVVLAKADGKFLDPEEDTSFFKGILSGAPASIGPFFVGNVERGLVLIFKTWYLMEGDALNGDNLKHIQTVMVAAPSSQTKK